MRNLESFLIERYLLNDKVTSFTLSIHDYDCNFKIISDKSYKECGAKKLIHDLLDFTIDTCSIVGAYDYKIKDNKVNLTIYVTPMSELDLKYD